ncbi:hypothetical protein BLNAU_1097 [Blattamonas nauphoetae]|uniref:Uncharacterized protein n=1 Tax=Blattamonas nauphoetae TaxID=2049346 RepID=A0ABQ9YJS6_9EUKA|nr:hypothetical protein BLNAU_1097 [Blattamonas nauphoetae]
MPVFFTVTSCLTYFENDATTRCSLIDIPAMLREWPTAHEKMRRRWNMIVGSLRKEGIGDIFEQRLNNDIDGKIRRLMVAKTIECSNTLGMNVNSLE